MESSFRTQHVKRVIRAHHELIRRAAHRERRSEVVPAPAADRDRRRRDFLPEIVVAGAGVDVVLDVRRHAAVTVDEDGVGVVVVVGVGIGVGNADATRKKIFMY